MLNVIYTQYNQDKSKMLVRLYTHTRHLTPRPTNELWDAYDAIFAENNRETLGCREQWKQHEWM